MYKNIDEYMLLDLSIRQSHIDLSADCIEIGGHSSSCKGLMAHFLKTTIPAGKKIHICHSCGNAKCSNPKHLYWGTPKENFADQKIHGTFGSIYERTLKKYGDSYFEERRKWSAQGGRVTSEKLKLSQDEIEKRLKVIGTFEKVWGWKNKCAKELGISHTQLKRFLDEHVK